MGHPEDDNHPRLAAREALTTEDALGALTGTYPPDSLRQLDEEDDDDDDPRLPAGSIPGWGLSWWVAEQGLTKADFRAMTMEQRLRLVFDY